MKTKAWLHENQCLVAEKPMRGYRKTSNCSKSEEVKFFVEKNKNGHA